MGRSPALLKALDVSVRVANRQTPILITGETGTGKDLLARAIHEGSAGRDGAFTKISCGLLRSDSSSHTFSSAPGGTLYLDEVTELPSHLQIELMQIFQDSEADAAAHSNRAKARVIASTSTRVSLIRNAKIRPDLYYRLSVVPIELPALRDRREDVRELVEFFVTRITKRHQVSATAISPAVFERWSQYHWPGNIRELENAVERMLLLAEDFEFTEEKPSPIRSDGPETLIHSLSHGLPESGLSLARVERDLLVAALTKFEGNQTRAARYLNISRRTLIYRMGKYKLRPAASTGQI